MDPTTNKEDSFRAELPADPSKPSRFVVRRGEDELIVESRRRLEIGPRTILVVASVLTSFAIWGGPAPGMWRLYCGTLFVGLALWILVTFWGRTTLGFRGQECWVVYRGMLSPRRLDGTLRSLDVVGIVEMNPPSKEYQFREANPIRMADRRDPQMEAFT